MFQQWWVDELKAALPELPDARRARYVADYGLTPYDAHVLVLEKETAVFYEELAKGVTQRWPPTG